MVGEREIPLRLAAAEVVNLGLAETPAARQEAPVADPLAAAVE